MALQRVFEIICIYEELIMNFYKELDQIEEVVVINRGVVNINTRLENKILIEREK